MWCELRVCNKKKYNRESADDRRLEMQDTKMSQTTVLQSILNSSHIYLRI